MDNPVTVSKLFEEHQERLKLRWVTGDHVTAPLAPEEDNLPIVGHFNPAHPPCIQVFGQAELDYLSGLGKNSRADTMERIFEGRRLLILAEDVDIDPELVQRARDSDTPLLATPLPAIQVISHLQYYLARQLAVSSILHGVFMEVLGMGVLLAGASGIGKSELALELVSRGHRLVADDAPEFRRVSPDAVRGSCPVPLRGFLEVRGLGVLDIPAMFGQSATKADKNLRLIIALTPVAQLELQETERLTGSLHKRQVLGVDIPEVTLPVAPGRNLAVMVEGAVRNHILRLNGYDAATTFIERQHSIMRDRS